MQQRAKRIDCWFGSLILHTFAVCRCVIRTCCVSSISEQASRGWLTPGDPSKAACTRPTGIQCCFGNLAL